MKIKLNYEGVENRKPEWPDEVDVPFGYEHVTEGLSQVGDLVWDKDTGSFELVTSDGYHEDIGRDIAETFFAVVRPIGWTEYEATKPEITENPSDRFIVTDGQHYAIVAFTKLGFASPIAVRWWKPFLDKLP